VSAGLQTPRAFDDLGITPAVQGKLDEAAGALRKAIAALEAAWEAAEADSDAECRCSEAITELEDVLYQVQWAPPAEH
jgi:hypothetical protein